MNVLSSNRAQKELHQLPDQLARTILKHIISLSTNPYPSNCKKLQGQGNWRLRVGSFRVIYFVDKKLKEITILRVADRKTIYR
ncbi:MAG: type II toxin-antitoxin system RelE/ParE family toxin [Patescibacteria group bacterium]